MEKEKKLIYIVNHYSKTSVQHFYHIINLLISMANSGVEIILVVEKCDEPPTIEHPKIKVVCQSRSHPISRVFELYRILVIFMNKGFKKIFIRISTNAAIIAIIAAKFNNGQTYYWQSGTTFEVDRNKPILQKILWFLKSFTKTWFVKSFVNYFVTGPESMIDYYISELKIKNEKMLLLYNDIDIRRFKKPSSEEKSRTRYEIGISKTDVIILMVHRLSPVRKTDKYIPAIFEDINLNEINVKLYIIGDGPERKGLEEKVKSSSMNDKIFFLGSKPNCDIEKYYKAADIFINPSFTEGFPRVVIEAMACGLPVVATNAGGTIDIFGEKQRLFISDRKNVDEFKANLYKLIKDTEMQNQLSNENLERVLRYSTDSVCEMYINKIFCE